VDDILQGKAQAGQRVVIYDTDAHIKGVGIAEWLADRGKQVEIVTRGLYLGAALPERIMAPVIARLARKGVKTTVHSELRKVVENSAVVADLLTGEERTIAGVDTVVLVTGNRSNSDLYFALKGKVQELHRIGDSEAPALSDRAIHQGYYIGRSL
ncbi:MAG: FAD-dependent oxidoreductase, partial [Chloroflexi bacterium]|nr:FAD-dependent oxidoreductase [Chloroflexota bacterium]